MSDLKETIVKLTIMKDHGSVLGNAVITINGETFNADAKGFVELEVSEPDLRDPYMEVLVSEPGKAGHVTRVGIEYEPGRTVTRTIDLHAVHEEHERAAKGEKKKHTLREYDKDEMKKFWLVVGPIASLIVIAIIVAFLAFKNQDTVSLHWMMLGLNGPESLGGLAVIVAVILVLNLLGALLRGEIGILEDAWAPILGVLLAVGWKPWVQSKLDYVMANLTAASIDVIFKAGGDAYAPLYLGLGIFILAMVRAITFQRMERRLDFDPLIACVATIGLFAYYHTFDFTLAWWGWVVIGAVFVIGFVWEGFKKPIPTLLGIALGVVIALLGNKTYTLVIFGVTAVVVSVYGMWKFIKILMEKPTTPEIRKLMETVPIEVLTVAWYTATFLSIALAGFGGGTP